MPRTANKRQNEKKGKFSQRPRREVEKRKKAIVVVSFRVKEKRWVRAMYREKQMAPMAPHRITSIPKMLIWKSVKSKGLKRKFIIEDKVASGP